MLEEVNHGDPPPTSPRAISQAVQNSQLLKEVDTLRQSLAESDREIGKVKAHLNGLVGYASTASLQTTESWLEGLAVQLNRASDFIFIGEEFRVSNGRIITEVVEPAAPSGAQEQE